MRLAPVLWLRVVGVGSQDCFACVEEATLGTVTISEEGIASRLLLNNTTKIKKKNRNFCSRFLFPFLKLFSLPLYQILPKTGKKTIHTHTQIKLSCKPSYVRYYHDERGAFKGIAFAKYDTHAEAEVGRFQIEQLSVHARKVYSKRLGFQISKKKKSRFLFPHPPPFL